LTIQFIQFYLSLDSPSIILN